MHATDALAVLQDSESLSLRTLSDPILNPSQRPRALVNGNNSMKHEAISSPAVLTADLAHYQELFSKLRFSYVEQVTKERFLRAIAREPPEFVSGPEICDLEQRLKADKNDLAQKKLDVRAIIEALGDQGRQLAGRHTHIQALAPQLEQHPREIADIKESISMLELYQEPEKADPDFSLDLDQTRELVAHRKREMAAMDLELQRIQQALPQKRSELSGLQDEMKPVQIRRHKAVEEADEARRNRGQSVAPDELEERGRWLRSSYEMLKVMLEF